MRRQCLALCLMLALAACKDGGEENTPDGGPQNDGGLNPGSPFTRLALDATPNDNQPMALAVGPGDVIGVAYFFRIGTTNDYDIRYVQISGGQVSQPEKVATVQRVYGLSVAFDSNGRPAVAYLGGGSDDSAFWFQSDMAVAFRTGTNQWTQSIAVTQGAQAVAGNPVSDRGFLVGLNPAIVFNGTQAIVAYRDGHDGQFPQQDWAGSDLEVAIGSPGSWTVNMVAAGGNDKQAYGGHISMAMGANGQPAVVHDQMFGSADGSSQNVLFQRRNSNGTWTLPLRVQSVGNTQKGASLAYDSVLGYGIAVVERSDNRLTFVQCRGNTGTQCSAAGDWTTPDPVYQAGTGGWYPSLAIDPKTHDPSIAFYVCSSSSGVNEGSCNPNDDELRVTTRIEGNWRELLVDSEGGITPKMAYLSTGQRVIAYRASSNGVVKLAVEQ